MFRRCYSIYAMHVYCNIEACSHNNYCHGKAIIITYSKCVCSFSYPACKEHAPYYIVICGLTVSTIFSHIMSQMAQFSEKATEHVCFDFLCNFFSESFLILKRIQQDTIINVHRSSCKVSIILVRF